MVKRTIRQKHVATPTKLESADDRAEVWFPPSIVYLVHAVVGFALHHFAPVPSIGITLNPLFLYGVGTALIVGSIGFVIWTWQHFKADAQSMSCSTPTPRVIKRGPYQYIRNPVYISGLVLLFGVGMVQGNWYHLLLIAPSIGAIHYGVVLHEEKYLAKKFTSSYISYRNKTPRYIPKDEI